MASSISLIVLPTAAGGDSMPAISKDLEIESVQVSSTPPLGLELQKCVKAAQGTYCCVVAPELFSGALRSLKTMHAAVSEHDFDLVGAAGSTRFPLHADWRVGEPISLIHEGEAAIDGQVEPIVCLIGGLLFGRREYFLHEPFDRELVGEFPFLAAELSLRWLLYRELRLGLLPRSTLPELAVAETSLTPQETSVLLARFGGFFPLEREHVECWRENLSAMQLSSPEVARRLCTVGSQGRYMAFETARPSGLVGKALDKEETFSDPLDLPEPPSSSMQWVFQGAGTGRALDAVLKSHEDAVIVIEPEGHLVCHLLSRRNWSIPLRAGRLTWQVPWIGTPELAQVSIHEMASHLDRMQRERMDPLHWCASGSEPLNADFHADVKACVEGPSEYSRRPNRPANVEITGKAELFVVSPSCAIFADLADSFQRIGCRVLHVNVPDRPDLWTTELRKQFLQLAAQHQPKCVLLRNRSLLESSSARGRACLERVLDARPISWWWDVPNVASMLDYEDPAARHAAFAFARDLLPLLPDGSQWLPPAARMSFVESPFAEGTVARQNEDFSANSVLLVGQSRYDLLRANLGIIANALAERWGSPGRKLAAGLNRCANMTAMYEFLHQTTEEFQQTIDSVREQSFAQAYYLDYLWRMSVTACFRMAAVERLAGFPLAIYGDDGWLRSKSVLREHYHGLVSPGQLPELYSRHPLHLNLNFMQVASTVNPRVLDLAACGSAVITDDRPELSVLFPTPEARPFSFRTLEELPDLVSDLSRRDLSEHKQRVRATVLEEHTMLHRAHRLAGDMGLVRTQSLI